MRCQVAQVAPSARPGIMTERVNQPKSVSARPAEHVGNVVVDRLQVLRGGVDRAHLDHEDSSDHALQTMARTNLLPRAQHIRHRLSGIDRLHSLRLRPRLFLRRLQDLQDEVARDEAHAGVVGDH
jgi:hypothetical protein